MERSVSDDGAPVVFAFKTVADAFAGRLTYFKVMSGVLKNDAHLSNSRSSAAERLAHIGCLMGKDIQPVNELKAGDIGAVAKLKDTLTGDTLHEKGSGVVYPPVNLPEPSIGFAVTAAFNVPRNNTLEAIDASAAAAEEAWHRYLDEWTRWNHVRTLACTLAMALLAFALLAF